MKIKKFITNAFHPNRAIREAENFINAQYDLIDKQAIEHQAIFQQYKEDFLEQIKQSCATAREEVNLCCQDEMSIAQKEYSEKKKEYSDSLHELSRIKNKAIAEITMGFNAIKNSLILSKEKEKQYLQESAYKVLEITKYNKQNLLYNSFMLKKLWQQALNKLLYRDCLISYEILKANNSTKDTFNNGIFKHYSLLVGSMQHLYNKKAISNDDLTRFEKFFHTLCYNKIEIDDNFIVIDKEITNLLQKIQFENNSLLSYAYRKDKKELFYKNKKSRQLNLYLGKQIDFIHNNIDNKYQEKFLDLANEYQEKQKLLEKAYLDALKQLTSDWVECQKQYSNFIGNLQSNKNIQLIAIKNKEDAAINILENNYQCELSYLTTLITAKKTELNCLLNLQRSQIKKTSIVKVLQGIAFINCTSALFGPISLLGSIINIKGLTIKSPMLIAINTVRNLMKQVTLSEDNIDLNIKFQNANNFNYDMDLSNIKTDPIKTMAIKLSLVIEKFNNFNQEILKWSNVIEHNLFYALNKEIFIKNNYFNQDPNQLVVSNKNENNNLLWSNINLHKTINNTLNYLGSLIGEIDDKLEETSSNSGNQPREKLKLIAG